MYSIIAPREQQFSLYFDKIFSKINSLSRKIHTNTQYLVDKQNKSTAESELKLLFNNKNNLVYF